MAVDQHPRQGQGDFHGVIVAAIIHQDHQVHDAVGHNLVVRFSKGSRSIICRHNNN